MVLILLVWLAHKIGHPAFISNALVKSYSLDDTVFPTELPIVLTEKLISWLTCREFKFSIN